MATVLQPADYLHHLLDGPALPGFGEIVCQGWNAPEKIEQEKSGKNDAAKGVRHELCEREQRARWSAYHDQNPVG
jgi:hypothetical protein